MNLAPDPADKEISLKEFILKFQEWTKYILGQWKLILLFTILGGAAGITYAFMQQKKYMAELTFVLEDNKTSSLGAYAGIASQFGLDLGGGNSVGLFTGDNILEFLRSRLMVETALLTPDKQNKGRTLADRYIEIENWKEKWENKPALLGVKFPADVKRTDFTILQDSVLSLIYKDILKNSLSVSKPDKKLAFVSVKVTTPDELFSKEFTIRLVNEATNFYINTRLKRSKSNVDKLQAKADSLEVALNRTTYSAAATQDLNLNPARKVATVGMELASRDKVVLQTMYGEVVKNLELSRITMAQETPIIQIVDNPILPLTTIKFGKIKGLAIGLFLGALLITIILLLRKIYAQIMN